FFSAEDADSVPPEDSGRPDAHKMEGAFYLWTESEIDGLLGDDSAVFKARFGVRPAGNAPQDPQGEFTGKNILYIAKSLDDAAQSTGMTREAAEQALRQARMKLFQARLERPRPHLDDKVLAAWNGLMLAAFARAARVLPSGDARARHLATATRTAIFLQTHLWDDQRRIVLRRFRNGEAGIEGYSEDYAFLIFGLIELFQAGGDARWLEWASALQHRMDELFWDDQNGGWFNTTGSDPSVILRLKEDYDGAEPAPSSISVLNLLMLAHLMPEGGWHDRLERTLKMFGGRVGQLARAVPMMMASLSTYHAQRSQIVVVAPPAELAHLMGVLASKYLP